MRTAFINGLCELAARDERIWLLCGDLGFSVLEGFAERFPDRFINAGVAEQNMTGVAAGLAHSGCIVFTYSIANFPVMRCYEQIRNDVCYHNLPVKVVSVGGGFCYGSQGYTHHGLEDLAVMRVLPNMTVVAPGDPVEARLAVDAVAKHPGPCYLRIGKAGEAIVHATVPEFRLGKAIVLRDGSDVSLISIGGMLESTVKAADILSESGVSAGVISMPTLSPIDVDAVRAVAGRTGRIVTVEEHGLGGLGTAVAEVIAQESLAAKFTPLYVRNAIAERAGSQSALRATAGLSVTSIVEAATALL